MKSLQVSYLRIKLFNNYKIHTTTIEWENIKGVRITPNVYTTTKNLDNLVEGIRKFALA